MKNDKCFICKSKLKVHAVLGRECDEIYHKNKMESMLKDMQTESAMKELRKY